jgi:hypothetical protein
MRLASILLVAVFAGGVYALEVTSWGSMGAGGLPQGWICGVTGEGTPHWAVEKDPSAPGQHNVLRQTGTASYSWCVDKAKTQTDGSVESKVFPFSGIEDQAGGVVWRWKDAKNYYIARLNAIEDNVILFSMVDGKRHMLKSIDIKVAPKTWHTLKIDFHGTHIAVSFDGKRVLEDDNSEIGGAGSIGVWTKADSNISFDSFVSRK